MKKTQNSFFKNIRTGVNTSNQNIPDVFVKTEVDLKDKVPKNLCNKIDIEGSLLMYCRR